MWDVKERNGTMINSCIIFKLSWFFPFQIGRDRLGKVIFYMVIMITLN